MWLFFAGGAACLHEARQAGGKKWRETPREENRPPRLGERRLQIVVLDVVEAFLGGEALVEQIEQPCRQRKDEQRAGDAVEDRDLPRQGQADLEEKCGRTQELRTSALQRRIRHWSLVMLTRQCNNSA